MVGWSFYVRANKGILCGGDTGGMTICSGRVGCLRSNMNSPGIWTSLRTVLQGSHLEIFASMNRVTIEIELADQSQIIFKIILFCMATILIVITTETALTRHIHTSPISVSRDGISMA